MYDKKTCNFIGGLSKKELSPGGLCNQINSFIKGSFNEMIGNIKEKDIISKDKLASLLFITHNSKQVPFVRFYATSMEKDLYYLSYETDDEMDGWISRVLSYLFEFKRLDYIFLIKFFIDMPIFNYTNGRFYYLTSHVNTSKIAIDDYSTKYLINKLSKIPVSKYEEDLETIFDDINLSTIDLLQDTLPAYTSEDDLYYHNLLIPFSIFINVGNTVKIFDKVVKDNYVQFIENYRLSKESNMTFLKVLPKQFSCLKASFVAQEHKFENLKNFVLIDMNDLMKSNDNTVQLYNHLLSYTRSLIAKFANVKDDDVSFEYNGFVPKLDVNEIHTCKSQEHYELSRILTHTTNACDRILPYSFNSCFKNMSFTNSRGTKAYFMNLTFANDYFLDIEDKVNKLVSYDEYKCVQRQQYLFHFGDELFKSIDESSIVPLDSCIAILGDELRKEEKKKNGKLIIKMVSYINFYIHIREESELIEFLKKSFTNILTHTFVMDNVTVEI